MPRSKAHKFIGTATGVVSAGGYGYFCQHDKGNAWQFALGGALGGYATSRLADILEPSQSLGPNHRGIFHGIALNGTVVASSYDSAKQWLQTLVDKANNLDNTSKHLEAFIYRLMVGFLIGAFAGHTSHLLADLTTPGGLPLLA